MASDCGGYFWRASNVKPANSGRWPRWRASAKVDRAGLNRAAWAKAIRSGVEALPTAVLACAVGVGLMFSSHNLEEGVRCPCMTMPSLRLMVTMSAVKTTFHLATKLAHGQQGLSGKSRDNMTMASSSWESREIKISFMCGMQDHARWGVDGNRGRCWALVADGGGVGEEMGSTTGIGDGVKW